jgi:5S rRNA maturation endonuclease (ribonuclease M5)
MRTTQLIKIQEFLSRLEDTLVLVEGLKDKEVLKKLGVKNILEISGKPINTVTEQAAIKSEVVILTDYDKEGEKLCNVLEKLLRAEGVSVRLDLRKKFRSISKVTKIEELVNIADVICNDLVAEYEKNNRRNKTKFNL